MLAMFLVYNQQHRWWGWECFQSIIKSRERLGFLKEGFLSPVTG